MNVPREINADAAKRLATEKHTPMMHFGLQNKSSGIVDVTHFYFGKVTFETRACGA